MPIDNVDYSILKCIAAADQPLWKKEIHHRITEHQHKLPLHDDVSSQTIGRRVDKLEDTSYLESSITTSEEVSRNLLVGFQVTEDGKRILNEKRETLLKKIVSRELFTDDTSPIDKEALEQLIREEFSADIHVSDTEDYTRDQLLILLGRYFIEQQMNEKFSAQQQQQLRGIIRNEAE